MLNPARLPASDPRAKGPGEGQNAHADYIPDPLVVRASIQFYTQADGKEASTTPDITVQCKDDGPVLVERYALLGTGEFTYQTNLISPDYGLMLANVQATRSMVTGGIYIVHIVTDGDDGWDFVPILTLSYNDGSESQSKGAWTRLAVGNSADIDSAQYTI